MILLKERSLFANWFLTHGFYVYGVSSLFDYIKEQKKYSTRGISGLIKQDVLVMAGEDDIYTIYYEDQKKALMNARSVESRVFTREENASHHCQVGNLKLAMDYMIEWIDRKNQE
jgi:hypothetical protein